MIDDYIGECHGMPIKDMRERSHLFKPTKLFLYILISLIFIYSVTGLSFIYPDHDINESYHTQCSADCGTQVTYNSTYFEWETNISGYNYSIFYITANNDFTGGSHYDFISNNTLMDNYDDYGTDVPYYYVTLMDENNTVLYQINSSYILNITEFGTCPDFYLDSDSYLVNYYWNQSFNDTISDNGGSNISYCEVHIYPTIPLSIIAYNGSLGYFEYQPVIQDFIDEGYQMLNCSFIPDLGFGCFAVDPYCYDTDGYCTTLHDFDVGAQELLIINSTCMPTMTNYTQCSDITDENICGFFNNYNYCVWDIDSCVTADGFQNISCQTVIFGLDLCYYNISGCYYADQQITPPENESNENQTNTSLTCNNCTTHSINDVTLHFSPDDRLLVLYILAIILCLKLGIANKGLYKTFISLGGALIFALSIGLQTNYLTTGYFMIEGIDSVLYMVMSAIGMIFIIVGILESMKNYEKVN